MKHEPLPEGWLEQPYEGWTTAKQPSVEGCCTRCAAGEPPAGEDDSEAAVLSSRQLVVQALLLVGIALVFALTLIRAFYS